MPPRRRPIRILHVIRRLDLAGGAERIVTELVREVPGHDAMVFDGGASAFDLGDRKLLRARGLAHALWTCLRLRRDYDLFHLHMPPSIYLAILLGKQAIIHEHSTHIERRRRFLPRFLSRIAMDRAGAVIAVSNSVRSAIVSGVGKSARVFSLPNFVANLPDAVDGSAGSTDLLMVAAFRGPKRQDLLIRAMPFLPEEVTVSFAGDGPKLPECRRLAEELGVAHRIDFLGSVRDVSTYYAVARLCVLLSDWEGFGLVVLEAALFGKATVVSDVAGLQDSCPDSRLIYRGDTPQDLARKLLSTMEFCEEPDFRTRLRAHAEAHSLSAYAARLSTVYGQLHKAASRERVEG